METPISVNFGPGFHATSGQRVDRSAYERYLGRWSRLFVPSVLMAAEIAISHRVLDVATGTGEAAAMALSRVGRSGLVVGADISVAMLEAAHSRLADLSFGPSRWTARRCHLRMARSTPCSATSGSCSFQIPQGG